MLKPDWLMLVAAISDMAVTPTSSLVVSVVRLCSQPGNLSIFQSILELWLSVALYSSV